MCATPMHEQLRLFISLTRHKHLPNPQTTCHRVWYLSLKLMHICKNHFRISATIKFQKTQMQLWKTKATLWKIHKQSCTACWWVQTQSSLQEAFCFFERNFQILVQMRCKCMFGIMLQRLASYTVQLIWINTNFWKEFFIVQKVVQPHMCYMLGIFCERVALLRHCCDVQYGCCRFSVG